MEVGSHRGPRPGLRHAATTKLAEVEGKIAHLQQVRAKLADVLSAECSDLAECSCNDACPIPFADIDPDPRGAADPEPDDEVSLGVKSAISGPGGR